MSDIQSGRNFGEPIGDHVRIFRRGKKYYANYQLEGQQHRESLKTTNIDEARKRARRIEVQIDEGTHQRKVDAKSIEEGKKLYLDHLKVSGRAKKTIGKYTLVLERLKTLADKKLRTKLNHVNLILLDQYKITRVEEAVAAGKKPPSLQTLHDEVTIIKTFINFCLRRKLVITDPLSGLVNKEPPSIEQPFWTWDQVHAILGSCGELIRAPLTILALTGLRFGELQHLT